MVQLTERASTELRRLLGVHLARPHQGVRLRLNPTGDLRMTIDVPHSGDSIIRRDNVPVLIIDGRLAVRLAMRVLDFGAGAGGSGGFKLVWRSAPAPADEAPVSEETTH